MARHTSGRRGTGPKIIQKPGGKSGPVERIKPLTPQEFKRLYYGEFVPKEKPTTKDGDGG